jgi:hypothetical protein
MQIEDEHAQLLSEIKSEWNKAEEDIKLAEQVCLKVVTPAVKELRYAGRRIVDALHYIKLGTDKDKILEFLVDAKFDCLRARHDAIDVATAKMAIDLEIMVKKLGYEAILLAYPNFSTLRKELNRVRSLIAKSRGQREHRENVYSGIETTDMEGIIKLYNEMNAAEPIMQAFVSKSRKHTLANNIFGGGGFLVGIASLAFSVWVYMSK